MPEHGNVFDLGEAILDAVEPEGVPDPDQIALKALSSGIVEVDDFLKMELPTRTMILEPWLSQGVLAMVYAWRGIGKTFFSLTVALAITRNVKIGSWEVVTPVGVMYIDAEMPSREMQERIKQLSSGLPDPVAPLYFVSAELLQQKGQPIPNLNKLSWRRAIYAYLKTHPEIKLLILDNIASLTPGITENSKEEWDEINQWLLSLRFLGVAVLLVHHTGKSGEQRGTSGREDALDVCIQLSHPNGYRPEDGADFVVGLKKARFVRGGGAKPFRLSYINKELEGIGWTVSSEEMDNKRICIAMLGEGIAQTDIAKALECSKGRISQIKKTAIQEGYLTKQGTITQTGFEYIANVDIDRYL